jgi:hypothetical protein
LDKANDDERRNVNRWLALATVAVGGALVIPHASSPSPTLKGPGIVRITSREKRFTRVDVGALGATPGDMEISRLLLYNTRIRAKPIGNGQIVCVRTGDNFRNCNATYVLPAGKLVVSGVLIYRGLYDLAVIGGTGFYSNVRGTLTVTRIRQSPPGDVLVFRLVV